MAREIVAWCDVHLAEDERVPATTVTVTVDGAGPVEIDLCAEDRKRYVEPLVELLTAHGAAPTRGALAPARAAIDGRAGKPTTRPRHLQCLWCPLDYSAQSGYLAHLRKVHGFDSLPDAYGEQCPLCGQSFTALGAHTVRAHDATQTAAFVLARELGDPHGVVARRIAAAGA